LAGINSSLNTPKSKRQGKEALVKKGMVVIIRLG